MIENLPLPTSSTVVSTRDLQTMTVGELRAELARALTVTARHLEHLAAVWRELESRGEDLSHLRSGLWSYMPLIATDSLRAELVVQYAGHPVLLRRLAKLSVAEQDRLLREGTVPVVRHGDEGETVRQTPLTRLSIREISRVLTDEGIASVDEQREALSATPSRAAPAVTLTAGRLRVGSRMMPRADLTAALGEIAEEIEANKRGDIRDGLVSMGFRLTPEEAEALKAFTEERGVGISTVIRAALRVAGLTDARRQGRKRP